MSLGENLINVHTINKNNTARTKVLVICGPTATGKTKFAVEIAKKFAGEIVSADSRQVYTGRNLIYGKDIPPKLKSQNSKLKWKGRYLKYYEIEGVRIWLYDVVEPGEEFSVALWKECAQLVIEDIRQRGGLPIVVGGTGLYIKALTHSLARITIPRDEKLRKDLANRNADQLYEYLEQINPQVARNLNESDRRNPRRLVRAIEITQSQKDTPFRIERSILNTLQIGLTAAKEELFRRIDRRVDERIAAGASGEDPILSANPSRWKTLEHQIVRQQLTWFKKQPNITWYDLAQPDWQNQAQNQIQKWYNELDAKKD